MHFESSYDLIWFSTIYWCSKGSLNLWTNYSLTLTVDNYIIIWSHNTDKHGYGSQEPGILFPQPRFWPANKPMVSQFNLIICFCPGKLGTKPDSLTRCWDVYPKGENSDYTAVNPSNFCLIISSPDIPVRIRQWTSSTVTIPGLDSVNLSRSCKSCITCMWAKPQRHKPYSLLKQLLIPEHP